MRIDLRMAGSPLRILMLCCVLGAPLTFPAPIVRAIASGQTEVAHRYDLVTVLQVRMRAADGHKHAANRDALPRGARPRRHCGHHAVVELEPEYGMPKHSVVCVAWPSEP